MENDNKKIWLHRNNHYDSFVSWRMLGFYEKGFGSENECYISVGCGSGKLEKESFEKIKNSSEDKFATFEKVYKNEICMEKSKNRHSLYKFLFEFEIGDYLVIPENRKFNVFQIESDVLDYSDKEISIRIKTAGGDLEKIIKNREDFRYFRKLKPIKLNLLRREYAVGALCSELKYRGTTKELSEDAKKYVINAINSNKPISLYNNIIKSLNKPLLKEIEKLSPEKFEELIEWYFKKNGADEAIILPKNYSKKEGIEDADVKAIFHNLKLIIYVQAKRFLGKANLKEASQQIIEYKKRIDTERDYSDYTKMYWIICTAEEVDNTIDKEIRVIKGEEFTEMLLNVGLKDIDEAF